MQSQDSTPGPKARGEQGPGQPDADSADYPLAGAQNPATTTGWRLAGCAAGRRTRAGVGDRHAASLRRPAADREASRSAAPARLAPYRRHGRTIDGHTAGQSGQRCCTRGRSRHDRLGADRSGRGTDGRCCRRRDERGRDEARSTSHAGRPAADGAKPAPAAPAAAPRAAAAAATQPGLLAAAAAPRRRCRPGSPARLPPRRSRPSPTPRGQVAARAGAGPDLGAPTRLRRGEVPSAQLVPFARMVRRLGYDYLSSVTAVDWRDRVEMLYHCYGWDYVDDARCLVIRADLPRSRTRSARA